MAVVEYINEHIREGLKEPYQRKLARSILGIDTVEEIAIVVNSIAKSVLGWHQAICFHFEISVGAVFALGTGDQRCLIKFFGPDSTLAELQSRAQFQSWLHHQGYPCPAVLCAPLVEDGLLFVIEEYVDFGRRADGHAKADRELMAVLLANLVELGRGYPNSAHLPTNELMSVIKSPWPKPHNVLFDFDATQVGAEWIDSIGSQYKPMLDANPEVKVIGHLDWGAKHCRMQDDRISIVYDWDSVARLPETEIVGKAAVNHTASWYIDGDLRPSTDELISFVWAYEQVRSKKFNQSELELIVAAIYYCAGYGARCEYANAAANGSESTELREFLEAIIAVDLISMFRVGLSAHRNR